MKKKDDIIASTLGLRPLAEVEDNVQLPTVQETEEVANTSTDLAIINPESQEMIDDIEQARNNIKNIITHGDNALEEMMELAKQSESPRAFEVASTLMKTLLDANKDFVEMSSKKKYAIDDVKGPKKESNVTNNNLIVSTSDLLKMIKGETSD
jgi:hypothetical protein